jgi:hypothetical protein
MRTVARWTVQSFRRPGAAYERANTPVEGVQLQRQLLDEAYDGDLAGGVLFLAVFAGGEIPGRHAENAREAKPDHEARTLGLT